MMMLSQIATSNCVGSFGTDLEETTKTTRTRHLMPLLCLCSATLKMILQLLTIQRAFTTALRSWHQTYTDANASRVALVTAVVKRREPRSPVFCVFCYERNGTEPPLGRNQPPTACNNKFNLNYH